MVKNTNKLYTILAGMLVFGTMMSFCCLSRAESLAQKTVPNLANNAQSNGSPKGLLADRDNDGLSDGLQRLLNEIPSNQFIDVIVTFKGPGNAHSAQQAVGPFNVKRKFNIISGFFATMTAAQAKALGRVPGVFRVEENFMVYANLDSANRDFGTQAVRTDFGLTGSDIGICVLDTGVDPNHEQLDNGKVAEFRDFIGTATNAYDDHGHGTHVCSIAAGDGIGDSNAAAYKGVAPGAMIYAGKVLDFSGSGTADEIVAGLEWCAGQSGVRIISMSLGTVESSDGRDAISQAVNEAVLQHGKTAVVAAGNSGSGTYTVGAPGAASEAITVGAAAEWSAYEGDPNYSEGVYLASFSSRGPTADNRAKPDVVAPGVSITAAAVNTGNGYVTYSGTSMATPFVSGTVALALQANPTLTPAQVKNKIVSTAKDCGPAGPDNDWGAGLLDGYALVSQVTGGSGTNYFPMLQHVEGNVLNNGEWPYSFDVSDPTVPVAVTITIEGEPVCPYGIDIYCDILGGWEWTPDLDAELWGPGGFLAASTCMVGSECANYGRQEILHIGAPAVGTYTIYVYPFDGSPNNGKGGNFTVDISTGPVGSGCDDTTDTDGDGTTNCDDGCPNDSQKTEPGICGCGTPDTDTDGEGTADCIDPCPNDPDKIDPGSCGCGTPDTDTDGDGTPDCIDGCPSDPEKIDPGICGCGVSDVDTDKDGTADCNDSCPDDPNKIEPGSCGCGTPDTDTDGDGTPDCNDPPISDCGSCFKGVCDGVCQPTKEAGTACPDCSSTPIENDCGDGACDPGEDMCSCPEDCGTPAGSETSCTDGVDNDCDYSIDCKDSDCTDNSACSTDDCLPKGALCDPNVKCCSGKCAGIKCK